MSKKFTPCFVAGFEDAVVFRINLSPSSLVPGGLGAMARISSALSRSFHFITCSDLLQFIPDFSQYLFPSRLRSQVAGFSQNVEQFSGIDYENLRATFQQNHHHSTVDPSTRIRTC